MEKENHMHLASISLIRDPGVSDEDLVRTLTDWKRMKDGGGKPPCWGCDVSPNTLTGFLRLLTRAYVPDAALAPAPPAFLSRSDEDGEDRVDCLAVFRAPRGWADVMAQALSFMAYGLRPGSHMYVSWSRDMPCGRVRTVHREFNVVLNGDGEPEVEEVKADG